MSRDVVVRWPSRSQGAPTADSLRAILEDYLGPQCRVDWEVDRFMVRLGIQSFAHRREPVVWSEAKRAAILEEPDGIRAIEVWTDPDGLCVYVMTRHADEFTCAVADGFAGVIARAWRGTVQR